MAKVLVVGNVVVDLIVKPERDLPKWGRLCAVDIPIEPHIGGNGAICAAYLAKLIKDCSLVGYVGEDTLGEWIHGALDWCGVGMDHVRKVERPTSVSVALVDKDGRRAFLHHIGANGELELGSVPDDFAGATWLHLCSPFLLPKLPPKACTALLKKAKEAGLYTSLDLVWDPTEEWNLDKMGGHADVLFLNRDEGEAITGTDAPLEMLDMMATQGQRITVLKMGDAGCAVKLQTGESFFAPSFEVKAVDSTGAGDAFNAGFILSMLNELEKAKLITKAGPKKGRRKGAGRSAKDILEVVDGQAMKKVALLGNALGAISVTRVGGATDPPTQKELLAFVKTQKKRMVVD
jgi:sugar/nucleoside kinase (ribokinase family)